MVSIGAMYFLIPKLFDTKMYSKKLIETHFWIATIGIVLYITAMWTSGISQGLILRAFDSYGNLAYTFVESVSYLHGPYVTRAIGGFLFLTGAAIMTYNLYMTAKQGKREAAEAAAAAA